jgi:hypothetical protein
MLARERRRSLLGERVLEACRRVVAAVGSWYWVSGFGIMEEQKGKGEKWWGWRERGRTQLLRLSRSAMICAVERVGALIVVVVDMMYGYVEMQMPYVWSEKW